MDGRRLAVRESTYLVVNRGEPYTFVIESAKPTTTLSAFFEHGFVEDVLRAATLPTETLLDAPESLRTSALEFAPHLEPGPSDVLRALWAIHARLLREPVTPTASEEGFFLVARALVRNCIRTRQAASRLSCVRGSTRNELLRRLCLGRDYLLSEIDRRVTVAEAARTAGMSRYHFFRTFRAAFQITPHQLVTAQRLARARLLLRGGGHSVTEVCLECGFQSVSSFSALFHRHCGVSPRSYQLNARVMSPIGGEPGLISTF